MAEKKLGDLLLEQIPDLVVDELPVKGTDARHLKIDIEDKLGATVKSMAGIIQRKLKAAIPTDYKDDTDFLQDAVEALAKKLSVKFSKIITEELTSDSSLLKDKDATLEKLQEISEGYKQFSEEEITEVSKAEIKSSIGTAQTAARRREDAAKPKPKPSAPPASRVAPRTPVRSYEPDPEPSSGSWGGKGGYSPPPTPPSRSWTDRSWGGK